MMCFLDPTREGEAVSLVTRFLDTLQGVTVQVLSFSCFFSTDILLFMFLLSFFSAVHHVDLYGHFEGVPDW